MVKKQKMFKKKILVVLGGNSKEREISIKTGKACIDAIKRLGYKVWEFDPKKKSFLDLKKDEPDIIFNALHGEEGEDGFAQIFFEFAKIPYTHSGVLSSMKWIKENNKDYQWLSTFPTDTPFFKKQILEDFLKKIKPEESKLFFIKSNNTRHNIFGLWSIDLINRLEEDLENGDRKVENWANSVGVKIINMNFEKNDPFFNINTKEDLEKAKQYIL